MDPTLQDILTLVEKGTIEQRCAALVVLGGLKANSAAVVKLVGTLLDQPNPVLKDYALRYFEEVQPKTNIPQLLKMLDDAAFYAANSLVSDRFLLTTAFNLHFTRPVRSGPVTARGNWISGKRRVFVAEASLIDAHGEEIGRGTGTFMRSSIGLSTLPGYRLPDPG